jgi:hypothetical protein
MNRRSVPGGRVYHSKRDLWLMALLGVIGFGVAAGAIATLLAPGSFLGRLLAALFQFGAIGFVAWLVFGTSYTLTDLALRVRSGPFHWTVPYDAITAVTPTHNPLSSPALSLDRIRIRYRGSGFGLMISPEPRGKFLHDLAARTPDLRLDGDRLVPD